MTKEKKEITEEKKLKILVVDDEKFIRQSISAFFDDFDYIVYEAENGKKELEVFRKEKPDVILSDLRMPEVDGLELLATVKKESSNTPIIVISGTGDLHDAVQALKLGAWDYIMKPIYDLEVLEHAVKRVLERTKLLEENLHYQEHLEYMVQERTEKLQKALDGTLQVIISSVELRDPYTAGHQKKVAELARAIAIEMEIEEKTISGLYRAGLIHDVGKLSIPTEILAKPTKLTEAEYELIKGHPEAGYNILSSIEFPWPIAEIVRQHHEAVNGEGYPHGLKGDEIRIEAKILSVADVVEAIASHRPYRASLGLDFALKVITDQKGTKFDSVAVDACVALFNEKGYELKQ
jgi:putative nucleotidyltransferase with HDIG domain